MKPIPLAAPDGTIYAYACGVCHHVGGGAEALVRVAPGHWASTSQQAAESCCTCFNCTAPLSAEDGRGLYCAACMVKLRADTPPPDPNACPGVECRIGRGKCHLCGRDNNED